MARAGVNTGVAPNGPDNLGADSLLAGWLPTYPGWGDRFRKRLRDRRFWVVQALVLAVSAVHGTLELFPDLSPWNSDALSAVILYSIYLIPVIYASLNFGREGAIPTALWSAVLALPNIFFLHSGFDQVAAGARLVMIVALAVVIATRVDREIAARRGAALEAAGRRLSEAKYRRLFEAAGEAILVVDHARVIQDANNAASELFDRPLAVLRGAAIARVLGVEGEQAYARIVEGGERTTGQLCLARQEGRVSLEFVCSSLVDAAGTPLVQAIFRDVTERDARRDRLESYARGMLLAQEDERRRIAREIHDDFLQSVVQLCRRLDSLYDSVGVGGLTSSPAVSAALREARREAESLADDLRRFSRDLRPSILDDLGLVPAIRHLLTDAEDRSGACAELLVDGVSRLSSEVELCLFRIAQEALRNVERHAAASHVTVTLSQRAGRVDLTVADDGSGFAVPGNNRLQAMNNKLGLMGMRERGLLLGGKFKVTSSPGEGTTVQVSLPVNRADDPVTWTGSSSAGPG